MTVPWFVEMDMEYAVLKYAEYLIRLDENLMAYTFLHECVPYPLDDATHPRIAQLRRDVAAMVDHIVGESYADYYRENHHERPFEEQYQCSAEEAHDHLHRVRFLRRWLEDQQLESQRFTGKAKPHLLNLLDVACNDGWMAKNLEGLVTYTGVDLNPHCIERANGRNVPDASFSTGFAEDVDALRIGEDGRVVEGLPGIRSKTEQGFDVVVAYELVEHVKDPAKLLEVMVACCKPGGSLFVSTPLGAGTGGDLPRWWFVEPKGHVRAYTPQTFAELLAPHGATSIEVSETQNAGQLMVARVDLPPNRPETINTDDLITSGAAWQCKICGARTLSTSPTCAQCGTERIRADAIVEPDDREHLRADRAGGQGDPRKARGSRAAKR